MTSTAQATVIIVNYNGAHCFRHVWTRWPNRRTT